MVISFRIVYLIQNWFQNFCNKAYGSRYFSDLVYKFKIIVRKPNFSDQCKKVINVIKELDMKWISCDNLHVWL